MSRPNESEDYSRLLDVAVEQVDDLLEKVTGDVPASFVLPVASLRANLQELRPHFVSLSAPLEEDTSRVARELGNLYGSCEKAFSEPDSITQYLRARRRIDDPEASEEADSDSDDTYDLLASDVMSIQCALLKLQDNLAYFRGQLEAKGYDSNHRVVIDHQVTVDHRVDMSMGNSCENEEHRVQPSPEEEVSDPPRPRGVTLMQAAMMVNDGDRELAKQTKKRWHNSGQLPKPIGVKPSRSQEHVYSPSAMAAFLEKMECGLDRTKAQWKERLTGIAFTADSL